MMSAPAILGSLLFEGKDAIEMGYLAELSLIPTLVGMVVAAVSGYLAIRFMLQLIQKISLNWFALYVAIVGVVVLVLQLAGVPGVPPFEIPTLGAVAQHCGWAKRTKQPRRGQVFSTLVKKPVLSFFCVGFMGFRCINFSRYP